MRRKSLGCHELSEKIFGGRADRFGGIYDSWRCENCGEAVRVYGLHSYTRPAKCLVSREKYKEVMAKRQAIKAKRIYGCWGSGDSKHYCGRCKSVLIICPRTGHQNSEYWSLERDDGMVLKVCPNNCPE